MPEDEFFMLLDRMARTLTTLNISASHVVDYEAKLAARYPNLNIINTAFFEYLQQKPGDKIKLGIPLKPG